jgi:hypothetical protein
MKQSTAKRFSIGLIPTTLILAVLTFAFILLVSQNAAPAGVNKVTTMEESRPAPIKNRAELDEVTKDLDTTNLDSLDGELQTISKDTAAF